MGLSLTYIDARVLKPDASLRLRDGLYVHAERRTPPWIQRQWDTFANAYEAPRKK